MPLTVINAPLALPTYDANASATHVSVVDAGAGGWHGYRYWMAYSPYPAASRENPSICASNDGTTWALPTDCPNPVFPQANAVTDGYAYWSDPNLVLSPDGTALWLYFRGTGGASNEGIYRSTSTDGVTWSARASLFTNATGSKNMAPCVVVEADGTCSMWLVNDSAATLNLRVVKRTSADGETWSAAADCAVPVTYPLWHIEVKRIGSTYHMLGLHNGTTSTFQWRMHYLTSADGQTWVSGDWPDLPLTGLSFDSGNGYYKSSFTPILGTTPQQWNVWLVGMTGLTPASATHRVAYLQGDFRALLRPAGTNTTESNTQSSIAATIPAAGVAAGHHVLVAVARTGTMSSVTTCADSRSNTYHLDINFNPADDTGYHVLVFSAYVTMPLVSGDKITVSFATAVNTPRIAAYDAIGLASSSWLDQTVTANSAVNGTAPNSGNLVTTQVGELLFAVCQSGNSYLGGNCSPYAVRLAVLGTANRMCPSEVTVSATGTYAASGTLSASTHWLQVLATYKLAVQTLQPHWGITA